MVTLSLNHFGSGLCWWLVAWGVLSCNATVGFQLRAVGYDGNGAGRPSQLMELLDQAMVADRHSRSCLGGDFEEAKQNPVKLQGRPSIIAATR